MDLSRRSILSASIAAAAIAHAVAVTMKNLGAQAGEILLMGLKGILLNRVKLREILRAQPAPA